MTGVGNPEKLSCDRKLKTIFVFRISWLNYLLLKLDLETCRVGLS